MDRRTGGSVAAFRSIWLVRAFALREWRARLASVCWAMTRRSVRVAMCGVTRMFGWPQKGWSFGSGSTEKASSVAADSWPLASAGSRSASTRWSPRPTLIRCAPRGSLANSAASRKPCVCGVSGSRHTSVRSPTGTRRAGRRRGSRSRRRAGRPWRCGSSHAPGSRWSTSASAQARPSVPRPAMPTRWRRGETTGCSSHFAAVGAGRTPPSATVVLHHGPAHVGLHARGHRVVDDAAQRQLARQLGVGQDVVDAGCQRLHQLQVREAARAGRAAGTSRTATSMSSSGPRSAPMAHVDARLGLLERIGARYCMSSIAELSSATTSRHSGSRPPQDQVRSCGDEAAARRRSACACTRAAGRPAPWPSRRIRPPRRAA